jgi:hypothetical protein
MTTIMLSPEQPSLDDIPLHLNLQVVASLPVAAKAAQKKVNVYLLDQLGTGLGADSPHLWITDRQIVWHVPVFLSLSKFGDLGQVGYIDVDAKTGTLLTTPANDSQIIQHANLLYAGATLQTK